MIKQYDLNLNLNALFCRRVTSKSKLMAFMFLIIFVLFH